MASQDLLQQKAATKDGLEDPDLERRGILQKSPHGYSAAMRMGRIAIRGMSGV